MLQELSRCARDAGIQLMATSFSVEDFSAVDPYVQRHKIASYEIGHIHLIQCAAEAGKPLYLSTGAATLDEIAWAVDTYDRLGGKELTLMQCTARYPAEPDSLNLNAIPWMRSHFNVPVGFSDHSRDPLSAPVAATALGATVIEKHFTLHNALPGPDHAFAVTPQELKLMVKAVRAIEPMLGSKVKYVHPAEEELRCYARRGVQAIQPIAVGDQLREGVNIAILRPGKQKIGVHPLFLPQIEGQYAKRAIDLGSGIQRHDF
jgi:N-acetylneuraminate synthase